MKNIVNLNWNNITYLKNIQGEGVSEMKWDTLI